MSTLYPPNTKPLLGSAACALAAFFSLASCFAALWDDEVWKEEAACRAQGGHAHEPCNELWVASWLACAACNRLHHPSGSAAAVVDAAHLLHLAAA